MCWLVAVTVGFLAKSLCDFRAWKSSDPLQEILHGPVAKSPSLCYSSSFPFLSKNESTSFFNKIIREAKGGSVESLKSVVERTLLETKRNFRTDQREHRLAVMKLGRGPASSATIEAEYLEVWVAKKRSPNAKSWGTVLPVGETKSDILVVTSIGRELDLDKLEHTWLQRDGKPIAPGSAPSVLEIQVPKTAVAASLQAAIAGEGFHRRYVMDVEILEPEVCSNVSHDKRILMRVPISSSAYIDLDEIRVRSSCGQS